jgi:hypothetical protein
MTSFIKDIEEIRQRAIDRIQDAPIIAIHNGDTVRSTQILNEALATERVSVLRCMHYYFMATGVHGRADRGGMTHGTRGSKLPQKNRKRRAA